jgi:hypothetical protein
MLDEERKRLVNMISTLANLLVLSNFLMFRFASDDPNRWTLSLTIITWTIFIAAKITVNTWLYFSYYKKTTEPAKT